MSESKSNNHNNSIKENESFIKLIQVAHDNEDARLQMLSLASLSTFHRKSYLNTLVETMSMQGAPQDFIDALSLFKDDKVVKAALLYLNK